MRLRPIQFLGITLLAALQSDCYSCPENPCERNFDLQLWCATSKILDLLAWCATSKVCRVDGKLVTECEADGTTPDCRLWRVTPSSRIEIPFDQVWPVLGKRNDLFIWWGHTFGDEQNVELFFDGVPESEGMCERKPGPDTGSIRCDNLPPTLKLLEFRYNLPGASGGSALIYMDMFDTECEAAHPTCPL
jgi:hypothetical protein